MPNPEGDFIWYELMTVDHAGAKSFYDEVVGWTVDPDAVAPGLDYRMIHIAGGEMAGGVLTLDDAMVGGGARPQWIAYVHAPDVDARAEAIRAAGGTVTRAPWDQPGVGRLAMVADPSGASFYLMAPIPPEGRPDATSTVFSVDRPQHVRWNELRSGDPAGAVDFYRAQFGWTQEGAMPMGEMGDYRFVQSRDGVGIGAIMPLMPGDTDSMWHVYIGVDDIDRAAAAVTAGGGTIVQQPMEIPGGEFSLSAIDPQGAAFGLVGPRRA